MILDSEVIVQDARGASDFEALQAALFSRRSSLIYCAFDLLHLDGKDLREKPLIERRAKLKALVSDGAAGPLQFSEEFIGNGPLSFAPAPSPLGDSVEAGERASGAAEARHG